MSYQQPGTAGPQDPNPYGAAPGAPTGEDPGKTMGIVGLVLAFFCSLAGLIVSILAYNKSKQAGFKNNIALAGIIVAAVAMVGGFIYGIVTGVASSGM